METGSLALTHGLDVLRAVAEAQTPTTSVEVARRVGLHQSWVSRVLKTLSRAGYVRKPAFHSFAADYGVLALGGNALRQFPLMNKPRAVLRDLAERHAGLNVALAILWNGQLIYLMRVQQGYEPVPLSVGFPLHLSSVALRLLVDRPEAEALAALSESRVRYGWERPTARVPATESAVLKHARTALSEGCLFLEGYYRDGLLGACIPVEIPGEPRAALALSGPLKRFPVSATLPLLREGRRLVETAMAEKV